MSVLPRALLRPSCARCGGTVLPTRFQGVGLRFASSASGIEASMREGLKAAMKGRDKAAATCLKSVLADITNAAKASPDPNAPAPEASVMTAVRKAISQRTQAAESYAPGSPSSHPENHSALLHEITLLKKFLPEAPTTEAIQGLVSEIIGSLEGTVRSSKGVTGVVMNQLWDRLGEGKAGVDRKEVGKWVAEALKGK